MKRPVKKNYTFTKEDKEKIFLLLDKAEEMEIPKISFTLFDKKKGEIEITLLELNEGWEVIATNKRYDEFNISYEYSDIYRFLNSRFYYRKSLLN